MTVYTVCLTMQVPSETPYLGLFWGVMGWGGVCRVQVGGSVGVM